MLKQVKRHTLTAGKLCGVFRIMGDSAWRGQRLLIVGYHGVSNGDEQRWDPAFYMTPDALEARFRLLKEGGYAVLPLGDALEQLKVGRLPPRSVVLTFDDGMADFAIHALPLLKKFDFPATVYLTTYYSGDNRPVFGMFCSYLLWKSARERLSSTDFLPNVKQESWNIGTSAGREAALRAIVQYSDRERMSAAEKDDLSRDIARRLDVDYDALAARRIMRLLTPAEVATLAADGIDFQLHTHRHRTPIDRDAFSREIRDNRQAIADMTGRVATHFCYPSGVYEPQFLPWLQELGIASATTCDTGIATRTTNPLLLPRLIDTSNLSLIEFESWTTGVGDFLPLRPHSTSH